MLIQILIPIEKVEKAFQENQKKKMEKKGNPDQKIKQKRRKRKKIQFTKKHKFYL